MVAQIPTETTANYLYDPDRLDFTGWMRSEERLESIDSSAPTTRF